MDSSSKPTYVQNPIQVFCIVYEIFINIDVYANEWKGWKG